MKCITILTVTLAALFCAQAEAQIALPFVQTISPGSAEEVSIFIVPGGSGRTFTQAVLFGGEFVDATILLEIVDSWGTPVPHYPGEDIWLDSESPTAYFCYGGFSADINTDMNGETYFADSPSGGGYSEGPIWVYINGYRSTDNNFIEQPPVPLRFNSADINGDGMVNLVDVAYFSSDYFGEYSYRSDFYWDGVLSLADVGLLAQGLGQSCD